MNSDRLINLKFSLMQSLYWSAFCVLFGFLVPLYKTWGYSNFEIGLILTVVSITNLIAQPVWGMICDASGKVKTVFISAMAISAFMSVALPYGDRGLPYILLIIVTLSATAYTMSPLIDAWTMGLLSDGVSINYGLTRSFGSLTFAFTAAGFGLLLDKFGDGIRIPVYIGIIILLTIISFTLKSPTGTHTARHDDSGQGGNSFILLLHNSKYRIFILSCIIIYIGFGALSTFYPVLLAQHGGSNFHLGIAMFIAGLTQVPGMMIYGTVIRKKWLHSHFVLVISMVFITIKALIISILPSLDLLIAAQAFELVSYGFFLPAAVEYINSIVDKKSMVTAQMIFSAAGYGVGVMVGSFAGGVLSDIVGVAPMILIINLFSLSGGILLAMNLSYNSKNDRKNV